MPQPMDEESRMERMLSFVDGNPRDVYVSRHPDNCHPLRRTRLVDENVMIDYCDMGVHGVEILNATEIELDPECTNPDHGPGYHDADQVALREVNGDAE